MKMFAAFLALVMVTAAQALTLTTDAFYVADPSIDLVDPSSLQAQTSLPPCIRMNPHDVYPYWEVMPPFTGVDPECWELYKAEIIEAKARRLQSIMNCILLYANPVDLCNCVIDADNRFKLDCEIAEDNFWKCNGMKPPARTAA